MKAAITAFAPMICSGAFDGTDARFSLRSAEEIAKRLSFSHNLPSDLKDRARQPND